MAKTQKYVLLWTISCIVLMCNVQDTYGVTDSHLPDEEYIIPEGYTNFEIPCSKRFQSDTLSWHKDDVLLYNSATGDVANGYRVDQSHPLDRNLVIVEATDEYSGEYLCLLNRDDPVVETEFGPTHVTIERPLLPSGVHRIPEGYVNYSLPCRRPGENDHILWHRRYRGIGSDTQQNIYNSDLGMVEDPDETFNFYDYYVDESNPLDRNLVILRMTEEAEGRYWCTISYFNEETQSLDAGGIDDSARVELGRGILPKGLHLLPEGYINHTLDCGMRSEKDFLRWHRVYESIGENLQLIYDTDDGMLENNNIEVTFDEYYVDDSSLLDRNLVILRMAEEAVGDYICTISFFDEETQNFTSEDTGEANVRLRRELEESEEDEDEEENNAVQRNVSMTVLVSMLLAWICCP